MNVSQLCTYSRIDKMSMVQRTELMLPWMYSNNNVGPISKSAEYTHIYIKSPLHLRTRCQITPADWPTSGYLQKLLVARIYCPNPARENTDQSTFFLSHILRLVIDIFFLFSIVNFLLH